MISKIFSLVFTLVLPLLTGYLLTRKDRFHREFFDPLIDFTIIGVIPLLALLSFWNVELDIRLISLPFLGLVMQLVPGGIAWLRTTVKSGNLLDKGSYILSNLLCNRGVIGGLTVFILFGEEGYAYSQLVIILGLPALLAVGFPIARHFHSRHHSLPKAGRPGWRSLFDRRQAALLGVAAGILLNRAGIQRPDALDAVFTVIINITAWSMLLPVGASISFPEIKLHWKNVADIIPIRFLISPVIIYILARLSGLEGIPLFTVVTLSLSPTAINAVVISKLYSLSVPLAAAAFFITTLIYMAVILPALIAAVYFLS